MFKLKRAETSGDYHGFTLKEGYWYGVDSETGNCAATSGWEAYESVSIYTLENGKWTSDWYSIDDTEFELQNIPKVDTSEKLSFNNWLLKEEDITFEEYDELPPSSEDELWESYLSYFYDNLPKFVQKYL